MLFDGATGKWVVTQECQVITERHLHGGRLASWVVRVSESLFMRLILCETHARAMRVDGFKIREEN